jgi:hypothetical protein
MSVKRWQFPALRMTLDLYEGRVGGQHKKHRGSLQTYRCTHEFK